MAKIFNDLQEEWNVTNNTDNVIIISVKKSQIPGIKPGATVNLLRYATKDNISQSESLKQLIDNGNLTLVKSEEDVPKKVLSVEQDELQINGNSFTVTPLDSLQMSYDWLKSSQRDSEMGTLSSTNSRYLWLEAGIYIGDLTVDTKYVHLRIKEGVVLSGAITHSNWLTESLGTGSGDSYTNALIIDSAEAYLEYNETTAMQSLYIKQTADIDFTNMTQALGGMNNQGAYDGSNYKISNIVISDNPSSTSGNALYHNNIGPLENIIFVNPILISSTPNPGGENKSYAGILLAQQSFGSVVRNCHVINGTINHNHTLTGSALVGMIAGSNHADIIDCTASGNLSVQCQHAGDPINTVLNIGGITGYQTGKASGAGVNDWGQVLRCKSMVDIHVIDEDITVRVAYIGGIVGQVITIGSALCRVLDSQFDGNIYVDVLNDITNSQFSVGGFVGMNAGHIQGNNAKGKITAILKLTGTASTRCNVGGGIGFNNGSGKIARECWSDVALRVNSVEISSQEYIGGFLGFNSGDVDDCYARGSVYDLDEESTTLGFAQYGGFCARGSSGTIDNCWCAIDPYVEGAGNAGGFIGEVAGSLVVANCFWDSDTSGIVTGADAGAHDDKTTAEMVANATFGAWSLNSGGTWKQPNLVDYPKLFWE